MYSSEYPIFFNSALTDLFGDQQQQTINYFLQKSMRQSMKNSVKYKMYLLFLV